MISSSQLNLSQKLEDCLNSVWSLSKSKLSQVFNSFTHSETSSRTQTPENNSDAESSLDESSISKSCTRSDLDPTLKQIGDALQHSVFYSSEFLTLPSKYQALCTQIRKEADSLDLITQNSSVKKNRTQLTLMMMDLLNLVCEMVDDLYWNAKSLNMKVKAPFYGLKFFTPDFDLSDEVSYADYVAYQSDSAGKTSDSIRMIGNVDLRSTQLSLLRSAADASSIMAHQSLRALFAINAEGPHHVRIICYHAAGAICTEKIDLQTSINRFIEAMVCVLIKDPIQAGIDLKMNRVGVVTPLGPHRVVKDFVNSPAYLGKSLRVCLLESQSELSRDPSTGEQEPQRLVMKQIWTSRHSVETEAISSILKQTKHIHVFGLATWLEVEDLALPICPSGSTSKKRKACKITEDETDFFMSGLEIKQLTPIPIYNTSETSNFPHPSKPPSLCNVRYFSRTVGIPLYHAAGFQQLVTAIFHAAIGHYNLYKLGWLHRDISEGNVLLVSGESVIQEPMQLSTNSNLSEILELFIETQCTAFLHDLDLAYSHQNQKNIYQKEVKGTRGFLSIRLLEERVKNSRKFLVQNSIDDLESFSWLLIKVAYQIQKPKPSFTETDFKMLKKLDYDCSDQVMLKNKSDFIKFFLDSRDEDEDRLSSISPIKPLIKNLFNFFSVQKGKLETLSKSKNCLNHLDVLVMESYKSFFKELISVIPNLPHTWDI